MRYVAIRGLVLSGLIVVAACGGGGGGGTPPQPPAVGSVLFVAASGTSAMLSYNNADVVTGGAAPNRTVSGEATTLNGPRGLAIDLARDQAYIANGAANAVVVYANARAANGNTAPSRTIAGAATTLNAPSGLYFDVAGDRLYIANTGANTVLVYDNAGAVNGNIAPTRLLTSPGTLTAPSRIAVDTTRNLLYVANGDGRILVYAAAATVSGAVAPVRVWSSDELVGVSGLSIDPVGDRVYVGNAGTNRILIFDGASTASGTVTPQRSLFGVGTSLNQPRDLFVDIGNDRLYVANSGGNQILVFDNASTATDSPTPARVLSLAGGTVPQGVFVDVTPVVLTSDAGRDGEIRLEDGNPMVNTSAGTRTGDTESFPSRNTHRQFFSFSLPATAGGTTVSAATLRLFQLSASSNFPGDSPYFVLGNLVVDHVDFGNALDPLEYDTGALALGVGVLANDPMLEYKPLAVTDEVQADVAAGRGQSQFRLRFFSEFANQNTVDDFVQFADGDSWPVSNAPPQLLVTFQP